MRLKHPMNASAVKDTPYQTDRLKGELVEKDGEAPAVDVLTRHYRERLEDERKYKEKVNNSLHKRHRRLLMEDDREIRQLTVLLGIDGDKKTKYQSGFYGDGLASLLDVCCDETIAGVEGVGSAWTANGESAKCDRAKLRPVKKKRVQADEKPTTGAKAATRSRTTARGLEVADVPQGDAVMADEVLEQAPSERVGLDMASSDRNKPTLRSLRSVFNRLNLGNLKWALCECQALQASAQSRRDFREQFWLALRGSAMPEQVPVNAMPDSLYVEHAALVALLNAVVDQQIGPFVLERVTDGAGIDAVRMCSALCMLRLCSVQFLCSFLARSPEQTVVDSCFAACRICPTVKQCKDFKSLLRRQLATGRLSQRCRILTEECLRRESKAVGKGGWQRAAVKSVQQLCPQPLSTFTHVDTAEPALNEGAEGATEGPVNPKPTSDSTCAIVAKKLRLKTPLRLSILHEVLKSEDSADAATRLLQMNINKSQRHEIITVLFNLLFKERAFNEFYQLTIARLCHADRIYAAATRHQCWERLKELPAAERRCQHLTRLLQFLLDKDIVMLTILKAIDFVSMDVRTMQAVRTMLLHVLANECLSKFTVVAAKAKNTSFCRQLALFLEQFVIRRGKDHGVTGNLKTWERCTQVIAILNTEQNSLCE